MRNKEKDLILLNLVGAIFFSRSVRMFFIVSIFFLLGACASDPKKASPVLSQATRLREVIQKMAKAYEQKDGKRFFEKLDAAFHPLEPFKDQVKRDFEGFSKADIQMTIEQIRIEKESLVTVVRWKGDWTPISGGTSLRKRGHAVFRWTSKGNLHLLGIKGNPPFGVF
ncbi:MAG: nuclear transport factor 2 family protein [Nitrospiria bacterium]